MDVRVSRRNKSPMRSVLMHFVEKQDCDSCKETYPKAFMLRIMNYVYVVQLCVTAIVK